MRLQTLAFQKNMERYCYIHASGALSKHYALSELYQQFPTIEHLRRSFTHIAHHDQTTALVDVPDVQLATILLISSQSKQTE